MRNVTFGLLSGACLVGTVACGQTPESNVSGSEVPAGSLLTVKVHEVLSTGPMPASPNATQRRLYGKFEIRPPQPGEDAILSNDGPGGACLIAQVPVQPKACNIDSECDYSPTPGNPNAWHGYCLGEEKAADRPGTCWVNPVDACLRGQTAGSYQTPLTNVSEAYAKVGQAPIKWRLFGCLSGVYPAGSEPPCRNPSTGEALTVLGPVREVP